MNDDLINKLPADVFNIILAFSYKPQSQELLHEIRTYRIAKMTHNIISAIHINVGVGNHSIYERQMSGWMEVWEKLTKESAKKIHPKFQKTKYLNNDSFKKKAYKNNKKQHHCR